MNRYVNRTIPPIVALLILAVCAWANHSHPQPKDAEPYHQAVRLAMEAVPKIFGDWEGRDQEVPAAAVALLRPNVLSSRDYENSLTGDRAQVLFVQCRDSRDMAGHYPPVCYPAHGWTLESKEPFDWRVGDKTIGGTRYRFSIMHQGHASAIFVCNFLMMPSGEIERDMERLKRASVDYMHHFYGAAQAQIVFDADIPDQKQQKIFAELVAQHMPVIQTVLTGAGHEQ